VDVLDGAGAGAVVVATEADGVIELPKVNFVGSGFEVVCSVAVVVVEVVLPKLKAGAAVVVVVVVAAATVVVVVVVVVVEDEFALAKLRRFFVVSDIDGVVVLLPNEKAVVDVLIGVEVLIGVAVFNG